MAVNYVSRDPFARGEYRRESAGSGMCQWCGQQRKRLYYYNWESDGAWSRHRMTDRAFCNLECFESYYR